MFSLVGLCYGMVVRLSFAKMMTDFEINSLCIGPQLINADILEVVFHVW